jgi:arabinoxylan arabinofuranohydrolase
MHLLRPASAALVLIALCSSAHALNPVVQTHYTADPAPVVHGDTVYLFASHDEDITLKNFFTMKDWLLFSSKDMVNWTDHGAVASLRNFQWAGSGWGGGFENGAWAPQAIPRNGKWYLYVPLQGRGIGVLVADRPEGPYADPLGRALIPNDNIDPTVFIDDDGQAYLAWGNPKCRYVKLNEDMISFDTSLGDKGIVAYDMTPEAFGVRSKPSEKHATSYEEAPWFYKRDGRYYLFFAGGPISEHLAYSTGKSLAGPWTYGGVVMSPQGRSFTNHPGVIDFKGKTYLFYHNGALPGGNGFRRSVCVDELKFNPDGSVVKMDMTKEGVAPVATLDPYVLNQAETIAWAGTLQPKPDALSLKTERADHGGMVVHAIDDGDYILVKNVDFGPQGAAIFAANVFSADRTETSLASTIELRLDSPDGPLIGTLPVASTGGTWKQITAPVTGAQGIRNLYFVFKGDPHGDLFKFDTWQFSPR